MDASLAPTDWSKIADGVTEADSRFAMDSKLYVQFYSRPMMLIGESTIQNRPIYADVDCVRILVPGDKHNIIDRIASDDDKQRFPEHFAKYKAGHGQDVVGTRLEIVPWMSRSKVEEYKYFNIHTVEQLAEASDGVGQKFQGFQADKARAKKWLEAATGTNARVSELEKQLAEMKELMMKAAATQQPPLNTMKPAMQESKNARPA